jgi:hypothetical protein
MALSMLAAYVELNAVRAGMVEDPSKYRFCGFGAAVAGDKKAREGVTHLYRVMTGKTSGWSAVLKGYRSHIYMQAEAHQKKGCTIDKEQIRKVLEQGGQLSRAEILHCRVRYFSDGVVLGSKSFVEDIFQKHRKEFGQKRKTGARKPRFGNWGELCTMRDLRRTPVSPPG